MTRKLGDKVTERMKTWGRVSQTERRIKSPKMEQSLFCPKNRKRTIMAGASLGAQGGLQAISALCYLGKKIIK